MKSRVWCRIGGGLGNQLFMYAAAQAMAWRNEAELVLDTGLFERDKVYRRIFLLNQFSGPRNVRRFRSNGSIPWGVRTVLFRLPVPAGNPWFRALVEVPPYCFQEDVLQARAHLVCMNGFWQSESYFADSRANLLASLTCLAPLRDHGQVIADAIAGCEHPVAIHMRAYRDVPDAHDRVVLPEDYALRGWQRIQSRYGNTKVFLFSDSPEAFPNLDKIIKDATWVTRGASTGNAGAIEDLQLMAMCKHFVIGNSSLSWWGAWLSQARWGIHGESNTIDRAILAPSTGTFNQDFVPDWWDRV